MSLTAPRSGDTVFPATVNTIVNILQQPSGGQDTGHYWISGNNYSSTLTQSAYIVSRSRNVTPVSLSIDTTDGAPSDLGSPATGQLTQGGAQIYAVANAIAATNVSVGGVYTWQY